MSRIGRAPIKLPSGVNVSIGSDEIKVEGPKGTLTEKTQPNITIAQKDDQLVVARSNDNPEARSKHGLMRSLIQNMVTGVSQGFEKKLEVNGVGFRVSLGGSQLTLNIGYSHPVTYEIPQGIEAKVDKNIITISGASKQQVGQVASELRSIKKPEPYKGKGIKYVDEQIMRKSGKSGKEQ